MLGNFSEYASVKITPDNVNLLSVTNPLEVVPKYVHIECDATSPIYDTAWGYLREVWLTTYHGVNQGSNGSTGGITSNFLTRVNTTPTAVATYYMDADRIDVYRGSGAVSGKWSTSTEYTIHFYA